jgi:hypothetical protein
MVLNLIKKLERLEMLMLLVLMIINVLVANLFGKTKIVW